MSDGLLSVRNVTKNFGKYRALNDVTLTVEHGEFIAMLGPSGCGKTTLLRSIAGFIEPDAGSISIAGVDVTHRPPNQRPLNTVFQNYALFPHLRIVDNVAYGPRRQGVGRKEAQDRAIEALAMVSLDHLAGRYPYELSGGQQQRAALARALVNRPKLLLLDEPLSALDLKLRRKMQLELKRLQERLGIAFIFVTHDQEEAMAMADRIIVMNAGATEQIGKGEEIYQSPSNHFVADFIGEANFIPCTLLGNGKVLLSIGDFEFDPAEKGRERYLAMIRPEHIELCDDLPGRTSAAVGRVEDVIDVGAFASVIVSINGLSITGRLVQPAKKPARGQRMAVKFDPLHVRILGE